jgi:hypothetical protein
MSCRECVRCMNGRMPPSQPQPQNAVSAANETSYPKYMAQLLSPAEATYSSATSQHRPVV